MSQWEERLREAYRRQVSTPRAVRLPAGAKKDSPPAITFAGDGDDVTIRLGSEAVVRNMQSNVAAFEGWALALKRWCGASVTLEWQPPQSPEINLHYERFLYRVQRFADLFGDWFKIGSGDLMKGSRVLGPNRSYLNVAGTRDASGQQLPNEPRRLAPEIALERALRDDPRSLLKCYGIGGHNKVDRQFPVGLFCDEVPKKASALFPGGKGAIDLVCLDTQTNTLWLFELKAKRNIPIGVLTELIFYTSVIRDTQGNGPFSFAKDNGSGSIVRSGDLIALKNIQAIMLGHALHPLIGDAGIIQMLNSAADRTWNKQNDRPTVHFGAGLIRSFLGEPLEIEPVV